MKRLLVLGASSSQAPFINTAKRLGCYVGVVDYNKKAPAIRCADVFFECSILDESGISDIVNVFKPDGITCGASDVGVLTAAKVCERFNLPSMNVETALRVKDKGIMIKAFEENGVSHPEFQILEDENQIISIEYPMIVKPVDNSASRGINMVRDSAELEHALMDSFSHSISHKIIVEEYLEGPEVSVELLVQNGEPYVLQVTDKITTGAPHFIEIGHSQPSELASSDVAAIRDLAIKAARAVGIQDGCCHAEIKLTPQGPKMIEIAGRMGADFITTVLVPVSTGINMSEYEILRSVGKPKRYNPCEMKTESAVAVKFIQPNIGKPKRMEIEYESDDFAKIVELKLSCDADKVYGRLTDNNDRIGHVIAKGETTAEALGKCDEIISKIAIEYGN